MSGSKGRFLEWNMTPLDERLRIIHLVQVIYSDDYDADHDEYLGGGGGWTEIKLCLPFEKC